MATDGHGQKAIWVGGKHHVAWQFLTLVTSSNADNMYPDDCLNLPVVFDLDASLDNESVRDDSISSNDSVYVEQFVEQMDKIRETNSEFLYNNQDDDDDETPAMVLLNVKELTLVPEGEAPVMDVTKVDKACEVLDDKDKEEIFTTKHTYFNLDQNSMKIISFPDLKKK